MKRILITVLVLMLCLCACSEKESAPAATTAAPTTTPTTQATEPTEPTVTVPQAPMYAVSLPVVVEQETTEDGKLIFTHIYQNISLTLPEPEVAEKIIVDFLNRTDSTESAAQILEEAKTAYAQAPENFIGYQCSVAYEPKRLDTSILSLLGVEGTFGSGPHSASVNKAVTYDLLTGDPLTGSAIYLETVTAEDILPLINQALAPQSNSLYQGYEELVAEKFIHGVDGNADWYFSGTGLCFFFSPYEIGPFASGTIIAEIPYSQLTGLLRDSYFPAERDTAVGNLEVIAYQDANLDNYSQFTELTIDSDSEKVLLVTDSSIQDIRITWSKTLDDTTGFRPTYTVFAAYGLTPGDAIMVQSEDPVEVTFTSGDTQQTQQVTAQ